MRAQCKDSPFANKKLFSIRDVREPDCLPQGLEPHAKPAANKPAPKVAKPGAKPSAKRATKPAVKVAAKPAAMPAAGDPMPVALMEHVKLFKGKYSRQKKWHTVPVSQLTRGHIPTNNFLVILWIIRPRVCMSCFVSDISLCPPPPPPPPPWGCGDAVARSCIFLNGEGGGIGPVFRSLMSCSFRLECVSSDTLRTT